MKPRPLKRACAPCKTRSRVITAVAFLLLFPQLVAPGLAQSTSWKPGWNSNDSRRPVATSDRSPFNALGVVHIAGFTPGGSSFSGYGTGALIGPSHVLTAAHVVCPLRTYTDGRGDTLSYRILPRNNVGEVNWSFRPAVHGPYDRAPRIVVRNIYCPKEFSDGTAQVAKFLHGSGTAFAMYDYAVLELETPINLDQYFGLQAWDENTVNKHSAGIRLTGYDMHYEQNSLSMSSPSMLQVHKLYQIDRPAAIRAGFLSGKLNRLRIDDRMTFEGEWHADDGSSGGPLWTMIDGKPVICGISTGSFGIFSGTTHTRIGRIITRSLHAEIMRIMKWHHDRCDMGPDATVLEMFSGPPSPPLCIQEKQPDGTPYPQSGQASGSSSSSSESSGNFRPSKP